MARRGTFGQVPQSAPSLTSTIVAIAREMQSRRDQNIMDAWKNGGKFEGKDATDERVLAYWRARLKGVDKDDPLADTYRNTITQYEYAISESKMSTRYAQGKVGNGAMARFYLNWAKKVPHNTEFYRVLQRDAAQFMRAARSGSAAGAARAKEKAYQDAQSATNARYEKAGQYLSDTFRALAQANALIGMGDNEDLTDFDPSDPDSMLRIIHAINGVPNPFVGSSAEGGGVVDQVLYHDPITGKPVTGSDIRAKMKALDPNFSGSMSLDYYSTMLKQQMKGQQIRLERARKTGHATDVKNIEGWLQYTAEVGRQANAWPIEQSYLNAREQFLSTWMDPLATPDSKLAAWQSYAGTLTGLATDPKHPADDATRARLLAEVEGNDKVSSLAEDFTGLGSPDHTTTGETGQGDIAETHADLERFVAMQEGVAAGQMVWAMGVTKNGVFVPTPGGREIGAAAPQDVLAASPDSAVQVFVPQAGANPIAVWTAGIPVNAVARDANGDIISPFEQVGGASANNQVATAYDVVVNGQSVRVFSYKGSDGHTYYTNDAPWSDDIAPRDDPGSGQIVLDVSRFMPTSLEGVDVSGNGAYYIDPADPDGKVHYNPSALVFATDPVRATAGPDPLTDSFSPTIAAILSTTDGINTLHRLGQDPAFRTQIDLEARQAAGMSQDPTTGAWVGGDQSAYDRFSFSANMMTSPDLRHGNDLVGATFPMFQRDTTEPTFQGLPSGFTGGPTSMSDATTRLPSDEVRGTSFDALGSAFEVGKNLIKDIASGGSAKGVLTLRTEGELKVPAAPQIVPTPVGPTVAPVKVAQFEKQMAPEVSVTTTTAPTIGGGTAPTAGTASDSYIQRRTGGY